MARRIVRRDNWPLTHQMLWSRAEQSGNELDSEGNGCTLRASSLKWIADCYGRWLNHLIQLDVTDLSVSPIDLVRFDSLVSYIEVLKREAAPSTTLMRIVGLERAIALMCPASDRKELRRLIARLRRQPQPDTRRPLVRTSHELLDLGERLLAHAHSDDRRPTLRQSLMFRDGLQIALLAMRPLRIANFCSLAIGSTLEKRDGEWRFSFRGEQMKNRKAFESTIPDRISTNLETYITVHRKVIMRGVSDTGHLWIAVNGKPQSVESIRASIGKHTLHAFGVRITPHLFRHCAATSLALDEPGHGQIFHLILGNSFMTSQRYYNVAKSSDASRHIHDNLRHRRRERGD